MRRSFRLAGALHDACRFGVVCAVMSLAVPVAEADAGNADSFMQQMDANHDGTLGVAEVEASNSAPETDVPAIDFSEADSNGDGQPSLHTVPQIRIQLR